MPKGGARHKSGPAPAASSAEWIDIRNTPRTDPAPTFPLVDPTSRELMLWSEIWRKPQATMWDKQGQEFEVGLYIRRLAEAEKHDASVTLGTLVRQLADALGLTAPGLRSNRWRLVEDVIEVEAKKSELPSARDRFKLAGGSGG
jgi:hypothetical protein